MLRDEITSKCDKFSYIIFKEDILTELPRLEVSVQRVTLMLQIYEREIILLRLLVLLALGSRRIQILIFVHDTC